MNKALQSIGINRLERGISVVLAAAWFFFALWAVRDGVLVDSPTHIVFFVLNIVIAIIYLLRNPPNKYPGKLSPHIVAFLGTFYVFAFDPADATQNTELAAMLLMSIAGILAIWAAISLNTAFGIRPVVREIKTSGPYRFVRHPLYTAYIFMDIAEVIGHPSFWNAGIALVGFILLCLRTRFEEAVLLGDVRYQDYYQKVRGRFLPTNSTKSMPTNPKP